MKIIRTNKKNIISIACHQGKVFNRFKYKERFFKVANEFKVHKSTIIFKTNIFKLIDKHPKLIKSSVTLGFLKNYNKDIKKTCNENLNEFELVKVIYLGKKKLKLSLQFIMSQKYSDTLCSKCCKIYKSCLTIMHYRVNFV